jgi:hypothetical protein
MRKAAAFLLPLLLALFACRPRQAAPVPIDSVLAGLVPQDAVALGGVQMEAVRGTPLYRKFVVDRLSPELDSFARDTGFDARKDVRELLVGSDGKNVVVLARGRFSVTELEAKLGRAGASKIPYKGRTLVGSERGAVVFLDASTAAAGPAAALRAMIDRGRGSGIPQSLLSLMKSVPPESQVWGVMLASSPFMEKAIPQIGNLSNLGKVLASVTSIAVGLDLRSGVKAAATLPCRTPEDARMIHDGFRGLIGMGRLSTPDNRPEMLRLYDAISVKQELQIVRVEAAVPPELLDALLAGLKPTTKF